MTPNMEQTHNTTRGLVESLKELGDAGADVNDLLISDKKRCRIETEFSTKFKSIPRLISVHVWTS